MLEEMFFSRLMSILQHSGHTALCGVTAHKIASAVGKLWKQILKLFCLSDTNNSNNWIAQKLKQEEFLKGNKTAGSWLIANPQNYSSSTCWKRNSILQNCIWHDDDVKLTSNDVGAVLYLSVMTEHREGLFTLKHCGWLLIVQVVICNNQRGKHTL